MSKHSRISLIVALALLFAFPVDAMAGGFGLFKRCRTKRTVCPPPVCQPCPPTPCETTPAPPCDPCETKTEESEDEECWYAIGYGIDQTGNPISTPAPDPDRCSEDVYGAIYKVYDHFGTNGWTLLSTSVLPYTPCPCPVTEGDPSREKEGKQNPPKVPGLWVGSLYVKDAIANKVIRGQRVLPGGQQGVGRKPLDKCIDELDNVFSQNGDSEKIMYSFVRQL